MKSLRNIFTKLRLSSRKVQLVIATTALVAVSSGVAFAGWTPDRPVWDYADPAQRIGSLTGPVFNSFINTPYYGDERAFFDASRMNEPGVFNDTINDATQGGQDIILRAYVHNNANTSTNGTSFDGVGVAHNAQIRIDLPTATDKSLRARAYISANNATTVTDTAELSDNGDFSIQYVPGSANLMNAAHPGGIALNDSIVTTGALIGYQNMDGTFPGCFDYQAIVEITVHVQKLTVNKQVRKAGDTAWNKTASVKPGDKVQWLIQVNNQGSGDQTHVTVSDALPAHFQLVPGSVRYIDAQQDVVQGDGPLFGTGGIDGDGPWHSNGGYSIRFDTIAQGDFDGCSVNMRNIGFAKSIQITKEQQSYADVVITKENCKPTTPPAVKPAVLQNTGAGDVAGIFTATTVGSSAAYHVLSKKRANRR